MEAHRSAIVFLALLAVSAACAADNQQFFASIGDLPLQSGQVLKDVRVGYRTFGTLNAAKDNAVLFPTWYLGKSEFLAGLIGPGKLIDSTKHYVIAVDALTNGVSTSPSNSKEQPEEKFPKVAIRDMVESQHRMLLGLGIRHLKAVIGISMGGFQTFSWVTAYPQFVDKAIPIVGSPRPTSYDLMFYSGGLKTLQAAEANPSAKGALVKAFADSFAIALESPAFFVRTMKREDAVASLKGFEDALLGADLYDMSLGLDALLNQDAYARFGGDEKKAAATVKTKLLVINASQDHCVNPAAALSFAKALHAKVILLDGDEGHNSIGPNSARLSKEIAAFLAE